MPDAFGKLRGPFCILDILLDELAPVRAKRRIDELDGGGAVQIDRPLRLPHFVQREYHVLLPADDVERRQLPQPYRRRLGMLQRIAGLFCLRCEKSEHGFHRRRRPAVAWTIARAGIGRHACSIKQFLAGWRRPTYSGKSLPAQKPYEL